MEECQTKQETSEAAEHSAAPPDEGKSEEVESKQDCSGGAEQEQNDATPSAEAQVDQLHGSGQDGAERQETVPEPVTTGNNAGTEVTVPEGQTQTQTGDQLPGYQEACVIAANNLRELDLKAYTIRLQRKFISSSLWQIIASLLLVVIETFELIFLSMGGCYAAGVWTGGLLVLTGAASAFLGRLKCFRDGWFRKVAWLEVLALLCAFASFILYIRHWMNSTNQSNLYVAFQVIHIGKLALCVLDFVVVVSKLYFFYRFDFYYRDFRSSTGNASQSQTANAADFNAIVNSQLRNASLSTIFDELERNSNNDEDARYVEPPPDYDRVVAAKSGPDAPQAAPEPERA